MNRFPPALGKNLSRARLRWAFVGLGVMLLSTLGALSAMAQRRLTEAQREREEMVASRIFDEMEREISAFLDLEADRPPYLSLGRTNPETWAPFVVGYFSGAESSQPTFARVVVAEGKTSEHQRRMTWALERASKTWSASSPASPGERPSEAFTKPHQSTNDQGRYQIHEATQDSEKHEHLEPPPKQAKDVLLEKRAPSPSETKPSSDRAIIDSLNRAPERRKSRASAPSEAEASDPFSDYSRAY